MILNSYSKFAKNDDNLENPKNIQEIVSFLLQFCGLNIRSKGGILEQFLRKQLRNIFFSFQILCNTNPTIVQ